MNIALVAYLFMSMLNFGSALFNNLDDTVLDIIFVINGVLLLIPVFKLVLPGKKS